MSVRPATLNDIATICDLLMEFRGSPLDESVAHKIFETKFRDSLDRAILVAEVDGTVRGLCIVSLVYKIGKTECRLDEVIVSESARGHGLGGQLLEAVKTWAWSHNADEISFTSRPSREAANRLYQKAGSPRYETNVYKLKREES